MIKKIMKDGNSHKIRIHQENMDLYGLKEGDIVEITIIKIGPGELKKLRGD